MRYSSMYGDYNPSKFDEYIEDAKTKSDGIELIGIVNVHSEDGFAIVKGQENAYRVGYKWDEKQEVMYGYNCTCEHNYYKSVPCKHMYVAERDIDNFRIVK